jgi:hypothetical protein
VLDLRVEAQLAVELVALVDRSRIDADDLPRAARQVDHPAVADDHLRFGAHRLPLPVADLLALVERQDVGVAERVAGLEAELRALDHGAEERHRIALAELRHLAHFRGRDARHALGGHVPRQRGLDLQLHAGRGEQVREVLRLLGDGRAGGDGLQVGSGAHGQVPFFLSEPQHAHGLRAREAVVDVGVLPP